ncbi:hypothetical protein SDJN03_13644, partial [Cucurbita argyrosperma subsp. sororia]
MAGAMSSKVFIHTPPLKNPFIFFPVCISSLSVHLNFGMRELFYRIELAKTDDQDSLYFPPTITVDISDRIGDFAH